MAATTSTDSRCVEIRKYPNRRYYDTVRGSYITLQELRDLICQGSNIRVVDFKSGEDITVKVLAQIILEHDTSKLKIFPSDLLHQLIRTNEILVRGFVESFFNQALIVFIESQRLFDHYLRRGNGEHAQAHFVSEPEAVKSDEDPVPTLEPAHQKNP